MIKVPGLVNTVTKDFLPITGAYDSWSLIWKQENDIKSGDTINAIEVMLDKHYDPTSLVTAISGMRRFYEMFPEIQQFRLEIPSRMPRKRSIIDVYSEEEQGKIAVFLSSSDISRRDAAICLLSFETGLRSVDICSITDSTI